MMCPDFLPFLKPAIPLPVIKTLNKSRSSEYFN